MDVAVDVSLPEVVFRADLDAQLSGFVVDTMNTTYFPYIKEIGARF